jgi:hypothetical protein
VQPDGRRSVRGPVRPDENPGGGPVWPIGCMVAVVVAAAAMGVIGLLVMELGT